jgi:hypothetical protein
LISRFLLPFLTGTVLFAQDPAANLQPPDLKAFLNLSDSQIQQLAQLQQLKAQALQPLAQQAAEAQQKLQQVLTAPNPDPAVVGQIVIAIATLGEQIKQVGASFQQQASAFLQPDQAMKLPPLQLTLVLHLATVQAVSLGLLPAP